MKQIVAIIVAIVLAYGAFSTVFHDTSMVGNIGKKLGEGNLALFGYLAYIDFPLLFYPLYRFYRYPMLLRRLDGYVGWLLFFLSFVMLQPLVVAFPQSGLLGQEFYRALFPLIGKAGLWRFWLMVFLLSLTLLIEEEWSLPAFWTMLKEKMAKSFSRKEGASREERETESRRRQRQGWDLSTLYIGLHRIFRNPFDHKAEEEVERILSMELDPIDEEERPMPKRRSLTSQSKVKKKRRKLPKMEDPQPVESVQDAFEAEEKDEPRSSKVSKRWRKRERATRKFPLSLVGKR